MDAKIDPTAETDTHAISIERKPGVNLDSAPGQVGDRELGDFAAYEHPPLPLKSFVEGGDQGLDYEPTFLGPDDMEYSLTNDLHEVDMNMDIQKVQEQATYTEVNEFSEEQEVNQELVSDSAKPQNKEVKNAKHASPKPGSLLMDHRVSYQLPPDREGKLSVFDLVWGKVKSHPWWPGQIFYPSDSSEKAMKHYKKDCYLVAYFGDRTFAWNEASVLKSFRSHFSEAERQNSSEAFQNAVTCALEEVARRVELGLACSCVSEEAYGKIKYQIVENTGIREESSKREGVDRSTVLDSFQPDKLTEYVRALAIFPTSGAERLELEIAKAQLLAFNQLRGYIVLPDFQFYEWLLEDADTIPAYQGVSGENEHVDSKTIVNANIHHCKRKHSLNDVCRRRKGKSMTKSMGKTMNYHNEFDSAEENDMILTSSIAGAKRKSPVFCTDDFTYPQAKTFVSEAKISCTVTPNPQLSFKVGDRIRRVASQLAGSSAINQSSKAAVKEAMIAKHSEDDADEISELSNATLTEDISKQSSLDEMLFQLHLSAQDPRKGYSFLGDIINFFSEIRNIAVTAQQKRIRRVSGRKKKSSVPVVGSPETFEFSDRNDLYWADMVAQDTAEVKPARRGRKRKDEKVVSGDHEKPLQMNPRKNSRKQYKHGNLESVIPTRDEKLLDLPTELRLNFGEMGSIPSEWNLNNMFRRFGSLKESETEINMQTKCARVVFKKRSDAEVAYSSAATYNIFGSILVNYQLNYTPIVSLKSLPLLLINGKESAT